MQQGGGELRGPSSAPTGTTIEVTVTTPDASVQVVVGGLAPKTYPVQDGKVQIPVPAEAAPGSYFRVVVGKRKSFKFLLVEVTGALTP
jgi:hypothetical protein